MTIKDKIQIEKLSKWAEHLYAKGIIDPHEMNNFKTIFSGLTSVEIPEKKRKKILNIQFKKLTLLSKKCEEPATFDLWDRYRKAA